MSYSATLKNCLFKTGIKSISSYTSFLQGKEVLKSVFFKKSNCFAESVTTDYLCDSQMTIWHRLELRDPDVISR